MTLVQPLIMLCGSIVGAMVGATLGFDSGPLWGIVGLVAGILLGGVSGPWVFLLLGALVLTLRYGPRRVLAMLDERPGQRHRD